MPWPCPPTQWFSCRLAVELCAPRRVLGRLVRFDGILVFVDETARRRVLIDRRILFGGVAFVVQVAGIAVHSAVLPNTVVAYTCPKSVCHQAYSGTTSSRSANGEDDVTTLLRSNPAAQAARHPAVVKVGRVGWVAKGIVYVIAGVLAIVVFLKSFGWSSSSTNEEASPTGAIKTVGHSAGGTFLLWVLAVGMLLYAAWRLVAAFMPGGDDAMSWVKRVGYAVSAVIYATFAITAISLAR